MSPLLNQAAGAAESPAPRVWRRMPERIGRFFRFAASFPNLVVGGTIILLLFVVALFAPFIATHNPIQQFSNGITKEGLPVAPNREFIWGTDTNGRDVFSRVVYGARVSLEIGVAAAAISLIIGVFVGLVSGYLGGWIDGLLMRVTDTILAFPFILFVVALVAVLRPSISNLFLAIGILSWANMARVVRGQVLVIKHLEYVEAARAVGQSTFSILFIEILPNVLAPVVVLASLAVGTNILASAALSFLGLGVQPPDPSWGGMLRSGLNTYQVAPWMIYGPGLALLLTVVGLNLFGDGLRDWLNPKIVE